MDVASRATSEWSLYFFASTLGPFVSVALEKSPRAIPEAKVRFCRLSIRFKYMYLGFHVLEPSVSFSDSEQQQQQR